jgi:serine/threonine protein kinase
VDQLYIVQKVLGPLIPHHMDLFMANPRFAGLKFPDMSRPETLQKKYVGNLSKRAMHFMQGLLSMSPADRPTSEDALNHSYFQGLHSKPHQSDDHSSVGMVPSVQGRAGGGGHERESSRAVPAPVDTQQPQPVNFASTERENKLPQSINTSSGAVTGGSSSSSQWGANRPPPLVSGSGSGIPSIYSSEDKARVSGGANPNLNPNPTPSQPIHPESPGQSKSYDHAGGWDRSSGVEWSVAGARSSDNTAAIDGGLYVAGAPGEVLIGWRI